MVAACLAMKVLEEDLNGVAEDDRIGDLHHGGFHVKREEQTSALFASAICAFEKGDERLLPHDGRIENFTGFEGSLSLRTVTVAVRRSRARFLQLSPPER